MSWWSSLVQDLQPLIGGGPGEVTSPTPAQIQAGAAAGNAADPLGGLVTVIEGIWAGLTDGKMWRSLGWILLGIVLMLLAVGWWIGPSAARRSPLGVAAEGLG